VSCGPSATRVDPHKQVVYFLKEGVAVSPSGQRLRIRGAVLDLEEYELLASFDVQQT
jgi:hypothetical protein